VDDQHLRDELEAAFGASGPDRRVVARQARDLADSGRIARDLGFELTAEAIVSNLADAPAGYSLVERWNWWIGSLDLSHGGYQRFSIRREVEE
jgi:hypothetical protein